MEIDLPEKNKSFTKNYPVLTCYILALVFSWSILLLFGAEKLGWIDLQVPYATHYLAAFGPMLAALVVTAATSGMAELNEMWRRISSRS